MRVGVFRRPFGLSSKASGRMQEESKEHKANVIRDVPAPAKEAHEEGMTPRTPSSDWARAVLIIGTYRDAEMRRSPQRLRAIEETLRDGYQMPISGLAEAGMCAGPQVHEAGADQIQRRLLGSIGIGVRVEQLPALLAAQATIGSYMARSVRAAPLCEPCSTTLSPTSHTTPNSIVPGLGDVTSFVSSFDETDGCGRSAAALIAEHCAECLESCVIRNDQLDVAAALAESLQLVGKIAVLRDRVGLAECRCDYQDGVETAGQIGVGRGANSSVHVPMPIDGDRRE